MIWSDTPLAARRPWIVRSNKYEERQVKTSSSALIRHTMATTGITLGSPWFTWRRWTKPPWLYRRVSLPYCWSNREPNAAFTGPNVAAWRKVDFRKRDHRSIERDEYAKWLHALQLKCNYCSKFLTPVAFVMDDVYFAFRTKELFSFRYFVNEDKAELSLISSCWGRHRGRFSSGIVLGIKSLWAGKTRKRDTCWKWTLPLGHFLGGMEVLLHPISFWKSIKHGQK